MFFKLLISFMFIIATSLAPSLARSPKRTVQQNPAKLSDHCNGSPDFTETAEILQTASVAVDLVRGKTCSRVTLSNIITSYSDSSPLNFLILNFQALNAAGVNSTGGLILEVTRKLDNNTEEEDTYTLTQLWDKLPTNTNYYVFSNFNGDTFRASVYPQGTGHRTEKVILELKKAGRSLYRKELEVDNH